MSSMQNDASNNRLQQNFFSQQLLNLLSELGEPGDTFSIESTYITNLNNEESPSTAAPEPREMVRDNAEEATTDEDEEDEEMPPLENNTIPSNSIPIQNLYNEMARLFSFPHPPNESILETDPSSNIINSQHTYSTSAPTTRHEIRRGTNTIRRRMQWGPRGTVFDSDVNRDYQNFISSLFNVNVMGAPPRRNMSNILAQSLLDPSQNLYKNVISEEGEDAIVTLEYKAADFPEQTACPMTLCDFKEGDKIAKLPCGHIFDAESILKWLKKEDARCPVCRKKLPSKEVKKNIKIGPNLRTRMGQTNRRLTSQDFISHMLNARIRREEEDELQQAIMASLRDSNPTIDD